LLQVDIDHSYTPEKLFRQFVLTLSFQDKGHVNNH
jgi:hypothetical protein